jgi:hypothetical protein
MNSDPFFFLVHWREYGSQIPRKPPPPQGMSLHFFILSGVRLSLLVLRPLLAYCTSLRLWRNWWNEDWQGKPKYSGKKPAPAPLCPPQIPTWLDPGSNPLSLHGHSRENPTSSRYAGVLKIKEIWICRALRVLAITNITSSSHKKWYTMNVIIIIIIIYF